MAGEQQKGITFWEGNVRTSHSFKSRQHDGSEAVAYELQNLIWPKDNRPWGEEDFPTDRAHLRLAIDDRRAWVFELSLPQGEGVSGLLHYSRADRNHHNISNVLWSRTAPTDFGEVELLTLTDDDHRAGFVRRIVHGNNHVCLGLEAHEFSLPDRSTTVVDHYVATGEQPRYHGASLRLLRELQSMTDERIIYGTATRHERREFAENLAATLGIDLRQFAREADLEQVLDLPDRRPLTRAEHEARDLANPQNSVDNPPPISQPTRLAYQSRSGDHETLMMAAFAKAGLKPDD